MIKANWNPVEQGMRAARQENILHGKRNCHQCHDLFQPMNDKEIFCSKECYETHEDRQWDYSDGGKFREAKVEEFTDRHGKTVRMRLCEELVDGRWEPFYTFAN